MRGVRNLEAATCYSYDKEKERYSRQVLRDVSCCFRNSYGSTARENHGVKGLEYKGSVIIRVFTDADLPVKPGDSIVLYDCADERPPQDSHRVIGMTDNRRAINPRARHWRIECV